MKTVLVYYLSIQLLRLICQQFIDSFAKSRITLTFGHQSSKKKQNFLVPFFCNANFGLRPNILRSCIHLKFLILALRELDQMSSCTFNNTHDYGCKIDHQAWSQQVPSPLIPQFGLHHPFSFTCFLNEEQSLSKAYI